MPSRREDKHGRLPLPPAVRDWCDKRAAVKNRRRNTRLDEGLLVALLARGDLGYGEIAQLVGLSQGFVWKIATGRSRKDLAPLIEEAGRKFRREEHEMHRKILAVAESAPLVTGHKHKSYDDHELVEMIAAGTLSYAQIGEKAGLAGATVSDIARGIKRLDLQPRIHAAAQSYRDQARQVGTAHLRTVVTKHITVGVNTEGETARKCREYVMNNSLAEGKGKPFLCGAVAAQRPPRDPDTIRNSECWELMYLIKGDGPPPEPDQESALAALPLETRLKIAAVLQLPGEGTGNQEPGTGEVTSTNCTNVTNDGEGN